MRVNVGRAGAERQEGFLRYCHKGGDVQVSAVTERMLEAPGEGLWVCVNSRTAAFCMDVTLRDGEQLRTRLRQIPELWFDALLGAEMMLGAGPFTFQIYKAPESGR